MSARPRPMLAASAVDAVDRRGVAGRSGGGIVAGLLLALIVATAATAAAEVIPLLGAPVIGMVAGILISLVLGTRPALAMGLDVGKGFVLQLAVVVLGTQLSLHEVVHVGLGSLPVMLGTLATCLGAAYVLGRRMRVDGDLGTLIGVGTAVCGASAIAAVSPVIGAKSERIAYAISTIFLFNVTALLTFPLLGHWLGLSHHAFGLFAGTAVNDTSSVVATASTYGRGTADYAVVVKLTRTLMIIPICLGLAALERRRAGRAGRASGEDVRPTRAGVNPVRLVPWFLVGFLVAAAGNSAGLIPTAGHPALSHLSLFLITTALASVGLSTNIGELRRAGARPLLLGLLLWITVAATSLLLQGAGG